jgi:uncharacterized damage-inducible protein DinB
MSAKDVIRHTLGMSDNIIQSYLKDLSDADLLVRPVDGMNNIAWQLGHLIGSERYFVEIVKPGSGPALPADFEVGHGRESYKEEAPEKFYSVEKYKELWNAQRAATLAVLDGLSEADLAKTDPAFPPYASTVGQLMNICGGHPLMHAGQFVAVRRKLGKPVTV